MIDKDATGTERVIFATDSVAAIRATLESYARTHLGSGVLEVLFRAGRVDAVWGLRLVDGRELVVKAHRRPVDPAARLATVQAQTLLADAGFPCPRVVGATADFEGLVLTTEELVTVGPAGDAHLPAVRRALARGLAQQVAILRRSPDIVASAGRGPAWCRYQDGPWPAPHDAIFDFSRTPEAVGWLDDVAATATALLREGASRMDQGGQVVGHADWCAGNTRFVGSDLVSAFDWDLVAAPEPQIAGFAAAAFTDGGTGAKDLPRPDEARAFLQEYDEARGGSFSAAEQEQAAAAVVWTLSYNARCQASFVVGDPEPGTALRLLADHADEYLALRW